MLICKRCHIELPSEKAARRHFAEEHRADEPRVDLTLALTGLTRAEAALVVLVVERMRAGGEGAERIRAAVKEALVDVAELDGNPDAAARIGAQL